MLFGLLTYSNGERSTCEQHAWNVSGNELGGRAAAVSALFAKLVLRVRLDFELAMALDGKRI